MKLKKKNHKKSKYEVMAKNIITNKNGMLNLRRKKKRIKNAILISFILFSVVITMCLKLPHFLIKDIKIGNTENVENKIIVNLTEEARNQNIFLFNSRELRKNIMKDKYIEDVSIRKILPNKLIVTIKEQKAVCYIKTASEYLILDRSGRILDRKKNIKKMNLIQLLGFDERDIEHNKLKFKEDRQIKILNYILELCEKNASGLRITGINICDLTSINLNINNLNIKIGTEYDMKEKFNKALNIIQMQKLNNKKGYVNVSYHGNPVVYIE